MPLLTRFFDHAAIRYILAFLAAVLCMTSASAALAQAAPAALTGVTILTQSPGETRLQLHFEPHPNGFAPVGNDVNRPALGFALTSRGQGALTPRGLTGLVRQISFEQFETILIM